MRKLAALTEALKYNPFEGDFGDQCDREMSDKLVKFRVTNPCHICGGDVVPGTTGRSLTMLWASDGMMTYRYCAPCTQAQANSWTDNGKSIDARYRLRGKTAA